MPVDTTYTSIYLHMDKTTKVSAHNIYPERMDPSVMVEIGPAKIFVGSQEDFAVLIEKLSLAWKELKDADDAN